jgi:hypothetical protein
MEDLLGKIRARDARSTLRSRYVRSRARCGTSEPAATVDLLLGFLDRHARPEARGRALEAPAAWRRRAPIASIGSRRPPR